jgi:putative ABC transport system permease protein
MFESLLISSIGGGLGIGFAVAIVLFVQSLNLNDGAGQFLGNPVISWDIMLITVAVLSLIGFVSGVFPARKAANLEPVESLRYE